MAKYTARIYIELDDDYEATDTVAIDEGIWQAVGRMLDEAGFNVSYYDSEVRVKE
jgi:hypothetical protein